MILGKTLVGNHLCIHPISGHELRRGDLTCNPLKITVNFLAGDISFAVGIYPPGNGSSISHLRKRKIIFKSALCGDMLVPWRVSSIISIYIHVSRVVFQNAISIGLGHYILIL